MLLERLPPILSVYNCDLCKDVRFHGVYSKVGGGVGRAGGWELTTRIAGRARIAFCAAWIICINSVRSLPFVGNSKKAFHTPTSRSSTRRSSAVNSSSGIVVSSMIYARRSRHFYIPCPARRKHPLINRQAGLSKGDRQARPA